MNILEAKQLLENAGYTVMKKEDTQINEGILGSIGDFAKRVILGDNKLDQLIAKCDNNDPKYKILLTIEDALRNYVIDQQRNNDEPVDMSSYIPRAMAKLCNDDKLFTAIERVAEMSSTDYAKAAYEKDKDECKRIRMYAADRIIDLVRRGY